MFGRGKNNILVLIKKIGDRYVEIDRIKYKNDEELVSNKKNTIPIPPNSGESFLSGKNSYTFFDISKKKYITFKKTDLGLSTEFLAELFKRKIIGQLIKAEKMATEESKTGFNIIKTVLLYSGLVLIGYLLGVQFGCG